MYCQNCGHQIPDGAKFCPNCGSSQTKFTVENPLIIPQVNSISGHPLCFLNDGNIAVHKCGGGCKKEYCIQHIALDGNLRWVCKSCAENSLRKAIKGLKISGISLPIGIIFIVIGLEVEKTYYCLTGIGILVTALSFSILIANIIVYFSVKSFININFHT